MTIDIHADDYALTKHTSEDMLKCMAEGKLDSISIVCNTSAFDECMEMMYKAIPKMPFLPKMSVHVNLVEGLKTYEGEMPETMTRPYSKQNADGTVTEGLMLLNMSWGKLYMWSWILGKKNPISIAIENEVKAQVDKCHKVIEKCIQIAKDSNVPCSQKGLRIDSHQHTHMIPNVWRGCIKAIKDGNYEIEYIRNSHEPLKVFLDNKELKKTYRPVNIIKNRILAFHSRKVDKFCDKNNLPKMYLWGLIMSGKMDKERVSALLENVKRCTGEKQRVLEILFHPGATLPLEVNDELAPAAIADFYLADGRGIELDAVMNCKMK